jgi:phosphoglycerol transferase MdoB-like AlkP superfamily enzyme
MRYKYGMQTESLWLPFRKLFIVYLGFVGIFFVGRLGLFAFYYQRISQSDTAYWWSFLYGLRMDTIVASLFLLIPAILLLLLPSKFRLAGSITLRIYLLLIFLLVIYIENATFPFFAEFDVRPNALFINYLEYPKEVLGNIWASYKIELLISAVMLLVFTVWFWRKSKDFFLEVYEIHYTKRILLFLPLFIILFIGVRSSFQHRPANISDATYTHSHLVNEITKNSLYAIAYAYYSQKTSSFDMKRYGKMSLEEAYQRMGKRLDLAPHICSVPFARTVTTHFKQSKPKNLVIFVQESLGAQFVGALGGEKGITPNLDRLSQQGLWFRSLYSNGTRSIRGLAGLAAGFLPVAGKGVLKRNKAQKDFFTVAQLLKPYGYHSVFIYGGEKRFDNMGSWFYGNGFDDIIDEEKFIDPAFHGIWGVSDEDLVKRANQEFNAFYDKQQPFVSLMFSTTNHTPFEYPQGRIELIKGEKKDSVKNAVKYADYSIGLFIDQARKEAYYKDTIFVIASDHNVRVYGDDLLPFNMFRIMGLILGKDIKAKSLDRLTMQPDLLATALDLIGIDQLRYPILGHSIYENHKKDISLMKFHQMYGLRVKDEIAIIQPEEKPITMKIKQGHLLETAHNQVLEKDALAFIIGVNGLYQEKLFRPITKQDCDHK